MYHGMTRAQSIELINTSTSSCISFLSLRLSKLFSQNAIQWMGNLSSNKEIRRQYDMTQDLLELIEQGNNCP